MWALFAREVHRFRKLWLDTVISPIVSTALYLSVFGIVVGGRMVGNVDYLAFVYVGLLGMMMINSSFSNPAFSLIIAKNVGNIIDLQLIPVAAWRIGLAYALAALVRALVTVAIALTFTIWFIPGMAVHHIFYLLFGMFVTGVQFGILGVVFGMKAKNFEALTFMTTFILQPMIFLAGVFYPISQLPGIWSRVAEFNPIHHNINILRYATVGYSDASPLVSVAVMLGVTVVLFTVMHFVTKKSIHSF